MTIMRKLHIIENAILYLDRVEETIDNIASLLRQMSYLPARRDCPKTSW